MRQAFDLLRFHMNHIVDVLQPAFDQKKSFLRNQQALRFKHRRCDDRVADAGFIFKADENKTLGSARTLAADHIARNANGAAMRCLRQISRAPNPGQEIIPDSQDYQTNLEKEMQRRIKDSVEQAKRKGQIVPPSQPTPPTKEKEEEI